MAKSLANSRVVACARQMLRQKRSAVASALLAVAFLSPAWMAVAQISPSLPGPQPNPEIFFTPATLNPVAGFDPATGALNGEGYGGDGLLANSNTSVFDYPVGVAYDIYGNLYIADANNYIVRVINKASGGLLYTYAGMPGSFGFSIGAYNSPTSSKLGLVAGLASFGGNVYFTDRSNNVVWKVNDGGISIFAGGGSGTCGGATDSIGDGCSATSAVLNNPWAVNVDANGNVYISDSYNDLIRVVTAGTGIISVFAGTVSDINTYGTCNAAPYSVSGTGPFLATQAHLCFPEGIAFDGNGNSYIADSTRNQVLKVDASGYVTTFAGGGSGTCTGATNTIGDGCPATSATLHTPGSVFVDPAGRVYISDFFNDEIRVVDSTGTITSAMGSTQGILYKNSLYEPDTEPLFLNGEYTGAVNGAYGIAMDPYGNLIVTDSSSNAVTSAGTTGQYEFGSQQIYSTVTTSSLNATTPSMPPYITIANPGAQTLNFSGTPSVTGPFAITGGTCDFSGSLSPGQSCNVVASFSPTADQAYTGTITINSNSNSSPNTILLSGTGIGTCTLSPIAGFITGNLVFSSPPNVAAPAQAINLVNNGVCPFSTNLSSGTFVGNYPAGSSAFSMVSNNCPATLNGGQSCTFNFNFTPTALTNYSAEYQLAIPGYGNFLFYLSGAGVTEPAVSFNPSSLTFPTTADGVAASSMSTVLTNVGNAPLTGLNITLAGSNPLYFAFNGTNNCGTTLAASASCTISVNFTPQAALANYSATISVTDNATDSPQLVPLSGTAGAALAPIVINDNETIQTTDTPAFDKYVVILDAETINTKDTPVVNPSKMILDAETIHTTDAPAVNPSKLILDAETIHTTDAPAVNPSKLILDAETIHTTDSPVIKPAKLILDAEIIHATDSPIGKILTSPTTAVLTASTATPAAGNAVTFTATVTSSGGTPTGSVTFYDGANPLATGTLSAGVATLVTSSLSVGTHSISAVYDGSPLFLTTNSNTLTETVTDFTVTFASTGGSGVSLTILPGRSGTYNITINPPSNGYTGMITLAVSGLPTGAMASFSQNPIVLNGSAVTSTLTITIPPLGAMLEMPGNILGIKGGAPLLLLGLLLPLFGLRRRSNRNLLRLFTIALCSLAISFGISSCGGSFFTQAPQTYIVTITATSGSNQHSGTINLTVP